MLLAIHMSHEKKSTELKTMKCLGLWQDGISVCGTPKTRHRCSEFCHVSKIQASNMKLELRHLKLTYSFMDRHVHCTLQYSNLPHFDNIQSCQVFKVAGSAQSAKWVATIWTTGIHFLVQAWFHLFKMASWPPLKPTQCLNQQILRGLMTPHLT
jgi:hypothetical protein